MFAEMTTSALAEGAIEGSAVDYEMKAPYDVDFKFSRFRMQSAQPRDVRLFKRRPSTIIENGAQTQDLNMPNAEPSHLLFAA